MRKIFLFTITGIALIFASYWIWQNHYVYADHEELNLISTPPNISKEIKGKITNNIKNEIVLTANQEIPSITYRWLKFPAYPFFLLEINALCKNVAHGKARWDNARIDFHWLDANSSNKAHGIQLWAGYDNKFSKGEHVICPTNFGECPPALIISNLGMSGDMILQSITCRGVKHAPWLQPSLIILILAWIYWLINLLVTISRKRKLSHALSALVLVFYCWQLCLPGPWQPYRAFGGNFSIKNFPLENSSSTPAATVTQNENIPIEHPQTKSLTATTSQKIEVHAKEQQISLYKNRYTSVASKIFSSSWIKKTVHYFLFFALAVWICIFSGKNTSIICCIIFALLSEICQIAFGFSWGVDDVIDLAVDGVTIFLGVCIVAKINFLHRLSLR